MGIHYVWMTAKEKFLVELSKQKINASDLRGLIGSSLSLTAPLSGTCCYWLAISLYPRLAQQLIALSPDCLIGGASAEQLQ